MSAQVIEPLFEAARDERWLRRLPKVCLHDHLDGALRPQTVIDLAARAGHGLPSTDAAGLARWFRRSADSRSLTRYLETFEHTVGVMRTAEALERVAREYVLDAAEDGVVYAEVRWAPEQHQGPDLGLDAAILAVARGLEAGESEAAERGRAVTIRQILCAMRQNERSLEIAQAAVRHRCDGVVGFDLAGPEQGFGPERHREAMDFCAESFLPVTLHAGEADGLESIRRALLAGRAVRLGHGVRILDDVALRAASAEPQTADPTDNGGLADNVARLPRRREVARAADRDLYTLGEVACWVRDREIPLEVCPSSNLQTDAAPSVSSLGAGDVEVPARRSEQAGERVESPARRYRDHPIELLRGLGFTVTVNPDNRLMSGTSMTGEFTRLAEDFGYGAAEFRELTLNAAKAAFLPLREKNDLIDRVLCGYDDPPEVGA